MKGKEIKSLDITIVTGEDDLRRDSSAFMKLTLPSIFGPIALFYGPTVSLNHKVNWSGGSSHTFHWGLAGQQIGREDLQSFDLFYASGHPDPFATQDNWNVDEITIVANYGDGTETVFQRADSPIVRFTGSHGRETFMFNIAP